MTFQLPERAVFVGTTDLCKPTLPDVTNVPADVRLVIISPNPAAYSYLRDKCRQAAIIAWVPDAAVGEEVRTLLQTGYDDVAWGTTHLLGRLRDWSTRLALHDNLNMRISDHNTLVNVIDEMAARPDLQGVLQTAILRMSGMFDIERAAVVLLRPGQDVAFVVQATEGQEMENVFLHVNDYPELREVIRSHRPRLISDSLAAALTAGAPQPDDPTREPNSSAMMFPLLRKGQVMGALILRGRAALAQVRDHVLTMGSLIASVTSVALGTALENDRLLSTQRDLLRKQEDARQELLTLRQFSDVFEQSFDGIIIADKLGKVRYANPSAAAILQRRLELLQTGNFIDLLEANAQQLALRAFCGDPVGDAYGYVDLLIVDEAGLEIVVSAAIRPLAEDDGVLVTFRDVTETREIEAELRQTKDFLENLIQSSVDAIVASDVSGNIILFNRSAERMFEYTAREAVGRMKLSALYPAGEADDILERLRSDGHGGKGRLELTHKDLLSKSGQRVPANLTAAIVYEGDHEVAVVGIYTDLRERLKMEEKLNSAQQKLRMSERQAVAVELAGTAAHELNQPLTSILGYAEILKRKVQAGEVIDHKPIEVICRETERMAAIVKKIGQITAYETQPYVGGSQILALQKDPPPKR